MKTHEIAALLSALASALRSAPNQTLAELGASGKRGARPDPSTIPMALSTLVGLSEIDKAQWIDFIKINMLPVDVRPRDAARDIIGKVLKYLEQNPDARRRLTNDARKGRSDTSPELMRALEFLLKE